MYFLGDFDSAFAVRRAAPRAWLGASPRFSSPISRRWQQIVAGSALIRCLLPPDLQWADAYRASRREAR